MCKSCGYESSGMKIQYWCDRKDTDCTCNSIIGFEKEPTSVPYYCGSPMKRIK